MCSNLFSNLLFVYGLFLICCGLIAVVFIGMKAKTALLSGGTMGLMAMVIAYSSSYFCYANEAGIFLTGALFCVFAWRSTKTLLTLLALVMDKHQDVKGKAIAFLIISLMAIVSLFVFILQVVGIG